MQKLLEKLYDRNYSNYINFQQSTKKKQDKIKLLLISATGLEILYVIRSLHGKLRIGLAEQTVLAALAHAFVLTQRTKNKVLQVTADDLKDAEEKLKQVHSECPCYNKIIPALLDHGFENIDNYCHLTVGIPVRPMLAKAAKGISEIYDKLKTGFTCEFKYDGERGQIHMHENKEISIFSRNLENNTSKYPDIIERIPKVTRTEYLLIIKRL